MLLRIAVTALLVFVVMAVPVVSHAGECDAAVVFFDSKKDILDVIALDVPGSPNHISFIFIKNDGTGFVDTAVPIGARARVTMTAADVYATNSPATPPPIAQSYVRMRLSGIRPFAATVTQNGVIREVGCITP